jgi:anti-anti-sigma factor
LSLARLPATHREYADKAAQARLAPRTTVYTPGTGKWAAILTPSLDHMRLSITTAPDSSDDYVRILGDVDLSDTEQHGLAERELIGDNASAVYVDLAGTTYMGSTLLGFLSHLGTDSRPHRPVVLCRPTRAARRMIHITGLDELATVRPDLPRQWPANREEAPDGLA